MHRLLKQAFTLIELLVVIAIIGILSGLIIVGMNGMTQKANIAKSQVFSNSLRSSLLMSIVGEWKFDGATSERPAINTDVVDSWGGVNNGTIPASPSIPTIKTASNCVSGSCLSFDGVDDYVDCGTGGSLNVGINDITIGMWIKRSSLFNTQQRLYIKRQGTNKWYNLSFETNNKVVASIASNYSTIMYSNISSANTITDSNWHYIVAVFNRASNGQIYIDGKADGAPVAISSNNGSIDNAGKAFIGAFGTDSGPPSSQFFNGSIDDVRIFNAAMLTSQIKEQYYAGLNKLLANGQINTKEYSQRINSIAKE